MELVATAASFATVVSLLADFVSVRKQRSDKDYPEFMAWLAENRHEELVRLLEQNAKTVVGIKALLNWDRQALLDRLDQLDRTLARLASAVDGFDPVVAAVRPGAELSDQALRILREFDQSGAGKALDVQTLDSRSLLLFEGGQGKIGFDDARFIDDDLNTLLETGLLRLDYNSKGEPLYLFTRFAADYVRSIQRRS